MAVLVAYVALVGGVVVYLTRSAWQQPVPEIAAEPVGSRHLLPETADRLFLDLRDSSVR